MRRQDINYKKVADAAEMIKNRGKEPSLTDICSELGLIEVTPELPSLLEQWYHSQPAFKRGVQASMTANILMNEENALEKNLELEKSLSLLRATLESTADGIMMVNGQGQVVDWNQKFVEMWRIPSYMLESGTESIGFDYILAQVADPEVLIKDVQYLYQNPEWQGELPELHFKDGRIFERFTQPQRVGEQIVGRVYSFRDITKKRVIDDQLRVRERAIEASTHGVVIVDISKNENLIIYVNKAFERITGYTEKEAIGQNLINLQGISRQDVNYKRLLNAIRELREEMVEIKSCRSNGNIFWCEMSVAPVRDSFGLVKHYVCIINDITQRRDMEKQLEMQATHDSLTALPNRVLLMDRVAQAILKAKKNHTELAFLFLDLDRFKITNDTLGHSIGDKLLQVIANRLLIATSDFDTVARLGGDEFVVLLPDLTNRSHAEKVARKILQLIEEPIKIESHTIKITASLGIGFYPRDGLDYESLMKSADLSMYYAKDNGRNNYRIFEAEMNNRFISHVQIDAALKEALKNRELYMVYQPIVDLRHNCIKGVEALMRWKNPLLGLVSPADFIPLAEENGMILSMGEWSLEESCRQIMVWHQEKGLEHLTLAVNISGKQLRLTQLPEIIAKVLKKSGLPAKYLELELTESILIEDIENTVEMMYALKDMGLKLVIDDFGTGYSSLSYLKQFPVDKLKIDRSFINEMVSNENDAAITRAIINLSHSLNLEVVAEGVETDFQKKFVFEHGCEYAQGYYFKPPEKPRELLDFLKNFH